MPPRYNRALSEEAERALLPSGPLHFLVATMPLPSDDPYALDIQIREGNELMYYHGTTRLLRIRLQCVSGTVKVSATADRAYGVYPGCRAEYAALMKSWRLDEFAALRNAFHAYLPKAIGAADSKYYRNGKEGYWQNRLCVRFGRLWKPGDEWLIVDRECVLGFASDQEKICFYQNAAGEYRLIRDRLQQEDKDQWGKPKGEAFGDELDLMALSPSGSLVVIELKHGTNCSGIYWGPLQVGFYHRAFVTALKDVADDIRRMARQKITLGLLPSEAATLVDRSTAARVDPVLAVAVPSERSGCWSKLAVVMERLENDITFHPSPSVGVAMIRSGLYGRGTQISLASRSVLTKPMPKSRWCST